ncbi:MAG: TonB family protein, partial [Desulfobacterales bacterium]|nr:TonB family protein [Desulfobacterales bacterium]
MKRLLPYIILALAFHAIILSDDFNWLKLAPGPTPATKSLSITLSADKLQMRKAQAAVPNKTPERRLEPALKQKPEKNLAAMPPPKPVEPIAQRQKTLPTTPAKNIVKKARQKINLKALTRKKQTLKISEAAFTATVDKQEVSLSVPAKIFIPAGSDNKPNRRQLPGDTAFNKKTHSVPQGSLEPRTTAAIAPTTKSDDSLSGSVLKIARPRYKQNTSPPYPRKARRLGYEGIVLLKVLIDENGRVDQLTVLESSGHAILD